MRKEAFSMGLLGRGALRLAVAATAAAEDVATRGMTTYAPVADSEDFASGLTRQPATGVSHGGVFRHPGCHPIAHVCVR